MQKSCLGTRKTIPLSELFPYPIFPYPSSTVSIRHLYHISMDILQYLGGVEVFESRGMQVCEGALKLLRVSIVSIYLLSDQMDQWNEYE